MILLGLNCGLGNTDIREMTFADMDLVGGWIDYPRSKTGCERVAKLWPETVGAIEAYLPQRKEPKDSHHSEVVFITRYGNPYGDGADGNDPICAVFYKLLNKLGMYREGLSFYTLRHTYRTQADSSKDEPAVNLTMGHVDPTMGASYRQHIDDDRIQAVSEHVRGWLFRPIDSN